MESQRIYSGPRAHITSNGGNHKTEIDGLPCVYAMRSHGFAHLNAKREFGCFCFGCFVFCEKNTVNKARRTHKSKRRRKNRIRTIEERKGESEIRTTVTRIVNLFVFVERFRIELPSNASK